MNRTEHPRIELNGEPATLDDLRAPVLQNYGHFTSMQVREGGVRGLGLHLRRLQQATQELFGHALDPDELRTWMRRAAGDAATLSLRVNVFSRAFDRDYPLRPAAPDVLITTAAARTIAATPLRVGSVNYLREAPHIKHVGTFGLFHQRRLAQARGYDDALFVGFDGAIAEGSIWNVGFFDGDGVVWPDAPMLNGISMQLLQAGLRLRGITSVTRRVELAELGTLRGAFFTNASCTAVPLAAIDEVMFRHDPSVLESLEHAMATQPYEPL